MHLCCAAKQTSDLVPNKAIRKNCMMAALGYEKNCGLPHLWPLRESFVPGHQCMNYLENISNHILTWLILLTSEWKNTWWIMHCTSSLISVSHLLMRSCNWLKLHQCWWQKLSKCRHPLCLDSWTTESSFDKHREANHTLGQRTNEALISTNCLNTQRLW